MVFNFRTGVKPSNRRKLVIIFGIGSFDLHVTLFDMGAYYISNVEFEPISISMYFVFWYIKKQTFLYQISFYTWFKDWSKMGWLMTLVPSRLRAIMPNPIGDRDAFFNSSKIS